MGKFCPLELFQTTFKQDGVNVTRKRAARGPTLRPLYPGRRRMRFF